MKSSRGRVMATGGTYTKLSILYINFCQNCKFVHWSVQIANWAFHWNVVISMQHKSWIRLRCSLSLVLLSTWYNEQGSTVDVIIRAYVHPAEEERDSISNRNFHHFLSKVNHHPSFLTFFIVSQEILFTKNENLSCASLAHFI